MENCIHFWAERCRKYALFREKFQIKVFQRRILDKKVREGICLSIDENTCKGVFENMNRG